MSRLPRCFYVGFQGLGHSHEFVFVPRSLFKLLLSAFPLGSLMLSCSVAQSAVCSPFPGSPLVTQYRSGHSCVTWMSLLQHPHAWRAAGCSDLSQEAPGGRSQLHG